LGYSKKGGGSVEPSEVRGLCVGCVAPKSEKENIGTRWGTKGEGNLRRSSRREKRGKHESCSTWEKGAQSVWKKRERGANQDRGGKPQHKNKIGGAEKNGKALSRY